LRSYGDLRSIPPEHLQFIRDGLDHHETESEIFVHAGIDPAFPLSEQPVWALRWERFSPWRGEPPGGKRLICGHTMQPGGRPAVVDHWVCIDTGVYLRGGRLTALDVTNDLVYQTNQEETLMIIEQLDEIAVVH
jgi:serine/threonine protein phosphatase 1